METFSTLRLFDYIIKDRTFVSSTKAITTTFESIGLGTTFSDFAFYSRFEDMCSTIGSEGMGLSVAFKNVD